MGGGVLICCWRWINPESGSFTLPLALAGCSSGGRYLMRCLAALSRAEGFRRSELLSITALLVTGASEDPSTAKSWLVVQPGRTSVYYAELLICLARKDGRKSY